MGQTESTIEPKEDIKSLEYQIFDKSFAIIEKYIKTDTQGLRDAYNREYEWVLINDNEGDVNWHKVMPKHMRGCMGLAYIHAIQKVSSMFKVAEELSAQSDQKFADKPKFREVYKLVDKMCDLATIQHRPKTGCFSCLYTKDNLDYDNHEYVMKAWDEFRRDHD